MICVAWHLGSAQVLLPLYLSESSSNYFFALSFYGFHPFQASF